MGDRTGEMMKYLKLMGMLMATPFLAVLAVPVMLWEGIKCSITEFEYACYLEQETKRRQMFLEKEGH